MFQKRICSDRLSHPMLQSAAQNLHLSRQYKSYLIITVNLTFQHMIVIFLADRTV